MGVIYQTPKVPLNEQTSQREKTTAGIIRTHLYRFGKSTGTLRSIPGIAGTNFSQSLANARNKAYPIARYIGNYEAFKKKGNQSTGAFLSQGFQRGGRILSGMLTGRAIDMAVRPFGDFGMGRGMGMIIGRQMRIQLGKQLQKRDNPIDKMMKKMVKGTKVNATAKVNGPKVNAEIKKNKEIARVAQKVLTQIFLNAQAFAPDVSSGQFVIGGKGMKRDTGMLNKGLMMDAENFAAQGIAYRDKGGRKYYKDVFGFRKPGEARAFLTNSIEMMPVRPTGPKNQKTYFRGEVSAGGGAKGFPWIWAVEYGGNIPVVYPKQRLGRAKAKDAKERRGRRKGSQSPMNFDADGNPIYGKELRMLKGKAKTAAMREFGMKYAESDEIVPTPYYIKPSFFMHRAAEKAVVRSSGMAEIRSANLTSPSDQYYMAWMKNAKAKKYKQQGIQNMAQKALPYSRMQATASRLAMRQIYQHDRPGDRARANTQYAIPGPRVDSAHGGFYSKELQDAIGIKYAPDDFAFSFNFPIKTTDTPRVLKVALDEYLKQGGGSQSMTRDSRANLIKTIAKKLGETPGRKRAGDAALTEDATRYVNLFRSYQKAQTAVNTGNQANRTKEYLDKLFDLSVSVTPGNRRARVSLRNKNVKARKEDSLKRQKAANKRKQDLGDQIFSDMDLRDIIDEIRG